MKARALHFGILTLLCGPVLAGATYFAVKAATSHTELSPILEVAALGVLAVALAYAVVTTVLVFKVVTSVRGVLAVHAPAFILLVLAAIPRVLTLVRS